MHDTGRKNPIVEMDQSHEQRWRHWQHAVVRDMAWVLASPPLLAPVNRVRWLDTAWADRAWLSSEQWLAGLDHHPAPLLQALARDSDHRLGSYFESLLAFWLAWPGNPLYRLIAHGVAIRANNRTLGELDFLVEDRQSGEIQHWEVAVKFYLGIRAGRGHENWIGPGLRDRLDLKVNHLLQHQLRLTAAPDAMVLLREMKLPPPTPVCLLKGRLFYPPQVDWQTWAPKAASPNHPTGWWMPQVDFLQRHASSELRWIRLPREHWLTPIQADAAGTSLHQSVPISDAQSATDFVETLQQSADNRAIAVIGLCDDGTRNSHEVTRGFVTPPLWPLSPDSA